MIPLGKAIVGIGATLIIIGLLVWFAGDKLSWFGRLPGDIRIERGTTRVYIPLTSMLIVSIGLSLLLYIIRRIF